MDTRTDENPWLRLFHVAGGADPGRDGGRARGGYVIYGARRLGQLLRRRPPGVTGHQWSTAGRTRLDFVVCDDRWRRPVFAVVLGDPTPADPAAARAIRMTAAVCAAAGLELLLVRSAGLAEPAAARRLVDYLVDARTFADGADPSLLMDEGVVPLSYREIIGRLPDGRRGFVNDLGAVARVAAVGAYAGGQVCDPIIRSLHVTLRDAPAEGWAWLAVRPDRYLFERTRIWSHGFHCGVELGQLAEDLAVAAVGERLKFIDLVEPRLVNRAELVGALTDLRCRRDVVIGGSSLAYLSFD